LPQNLPIPLPPKLKVPCGRLPRLLLKGMQDVYSFCKLRHIEDPMLHGSANSQLVHARAYADHGLPVIRLKPLLNKVKLVTGNTPRVLGESSQVLEGGACPEERFHGQEALYNILYVERKSEDRGCTPRITPACTGRLASPSAVEGPYVP
jgi:hypothetical protein